MLALQPTFWISRWRSSLNNPTFCSFKDNWNYLWFILLNRIFNWNVGALSNILHFQESLRNQPPVLSETVPADLIDTAVPSPLDQVLTSVLSWAFPQLLWVCPFYKALLFLFAEKESCALIAGSDIGWADENSSEQIKWDRWGQQQFKG